MTGMRQLALVPLRPTMLALRLLGLDPGRAVANASPSIYRRQCDRADQLYAIRQGLSGRSTDTDERE